ncbi:MAG: class I SAM-dependent methyltransferase [Bacteroidia bacterium]|nr:class I SAM-dependent methyltransferase [Bacteroidia bacterium]
MQIYKYVPKPLKKHYKKLFWRVFYNYIGTIGILKKARFLNHGIIEDHENITMDQFNPLLFRKLSQNLYLHLMREAEINGKNYMEIGCGRGAGLELLMNTYKPAKAVGVDISDTNIRYGKKINKGNGVQFIRGDAEKQIFPDKSFDVVLNLESSHCYASKMNFYKNVKNILKDDGTFLYSDLFWFDHLTLEMEKQFEEIGLYIVKKEDITKPIMRSIELQSKIRMHYVKGKATPNKKLSDMVALPGTPLYDGLTNGTIKYLFYVLKKK